MSQNRTTILILPIEELYRRLMSRIQEDVDTDDINEHLLYTSGYSLHYLLRWWIKYALSEVLALPLSPTHVEPMDELFAQYLKRTLMDFETDIFSFSMLIRRLLADWVNVVVEVEPHRLTLEII